VRKSIVISGIIMAFILGSLVSAPSVTAPTGGAALLAEQVTEIEGIIRGMQDELNNLHVPWGNVTAKPVGFATDTNPGGIFQNSSSTIAEPCNAGDTVTWDGAQWVCSIPLSGLNCDSNQIVKWDVTQWVCADIGASIAPNVILLHYAQSSTEFLSPHATGAPLDFTLLAKWKIEKADPNFAYELLLYDLSIYANMKGNVEIGWYRSVDGTTWKSIRDISPFERPVSFTVFRDSDIESSIPSEINYIAFAAANPFDEGSNGEVKDFSGTVTIHLPASESLTRII